MNRPMKIYSVHIRKPFVSERVWNWRDTVLAPDPESALRVSYRKWKIEEPLIYIPPLKECSTKVNLISIGGVSVA